jgi:hypothetical protein
MDVPSQQIRVMYMFCIDTQCKKEVLRIQLSPENFSPNEHTSKNAQKSG